MFPSSLSFPSNFIASCFLSCIVIYSHVPLFPPPIPLPPLLVAFYLILFPLLPCHHHCLLPPFLLPFVPSSLTAIKSYKTFYIKKNTFLCVCFYVQRNEEKAFLRQENHTSVWLPWIHWRYGRSQVSGSSSCACVCVCAVWASLRWREIKEWTSLCICVFEYSLWHEAAVCKCAYAYVEGDHGVDFWFSMRAWVCVCVSGEKQQGECVKLFCVAEIRPGPYQLHQGA